MQIGNLLPPRKGFDDPQEGRVYTVDDVSPTIRNDSRYWMLEKDESEDDKRGMLVQG